MHHWLLVLLLSKLLVGYLTPTGWQKPSGDSWNESGVKINLPIIELDFEDRLPGAIHWIPVLGFGFLLNIGQSLKQPPLFISFSTLVFPSILLHASLPTAVPTVQGAVRVVVISLSFPSFNPQSIICQTVWL